MGEVKKMLILEGITPELLMAIAICLFLMILVLLHLINKLEKRIIDVETDFKEWLFRDKQKKTEMN